MRRLGPVLTLAVAIPALLGLAGCSTSNKATVPPATTTSTSTTSTSTTVTGTTVTTTPPATATTVGGGPTTTIKGLTVFTTFTIAPPSPVPCNAPTMIELKWTANGTSAVALSIDGVQAARFGGGAQDHLQYFACDGRNHTYTLTAKVGTTTETVSRDVSSKPLN